MMALNVDTSFKMEKQILVDEFDDPEFLEFAIENYSEMFGYINTERVNIRIHKDITRVEERLPSRHANEKCFLRILEEVFKPIRINVVLIS